MTKRLPRSVRLKRLQKRKRKALLKAIRKALGVKRLHRPKTRNPIRTPFPIDTEVLCGS